jgi:tRNA (cytidine/uridine-2'-O-)-methyltransferase
MFNIVLLEPEIPQNCGNIVRTCVATNCALHLIKPLGFEVSDKYLKRAGLDYWHEATIFYYDSYAEFVEKTEGRTIYYSTTKAKNVYSGVDFKPGDFIMFGKETKGIDEKILKENYDRCFRLPMYNDSRSLNLSNAVAVAVYEAYRQNGFRGLKEQGSLNIL